MFCSILKEEAVRHIFIVIMTLKSDILKNKDMRTSDASDNMDPHQCRDVNEHLINYEALYCEAIENADGVPFQLVFGPRPGEGYYLAIGKGIALLTGIPAEEFTEKVFLGMIENVIPLTPGISADLPDTRAKFINGELKSYKAEVLLRLKSGERRWIQDSSLPLTDEETGKVIGAFGILFDINDRKRNLNNLKDAKERAEESDRLKSAFLHNISHEIRTPLNAIVGFSSFVSDPDSFTGDKNEIRDIITRSSDHLLEIFDDIVEISNLEAGNVRINKEKVNVNETLRKVYDRFREKAIKKIISIGYVAALDDSRAELMTDGYKLLQVLIHLVSNATKFTKAGEVRFGYIVKKEKLEFFVSDTGIGIAGEHYPMIFKSFFQGDSSNTRLYEGTGLGLSISKAYVELLGGEIWFNSQPGSGSVFYFTLPHENVADQWSMK
jgi:signal transduction histidine kinase